MTLRLVKRCMVSSPRVDRAMTFAVVTDLHNASYDDVLAQLRTADAVLIVGDLVNRHADGFERAAAFLRDAPDCAPTFYSLGNHERKFREWDNYWPVVKGSRVTVLDNDFVQFRGVTLGGLSSAEHRKASVDFLPRMAEKSGFRLLLCHHPEMYRRYVRGTDIDLTVAGHAHGGQIQLLGHGLYAPGQGVLPRLTHGFYDDGRLLVSRGMTNSSGYPRWNNPCELIMLRLEPGDSRTWKED